LLHSLDSTLFASALNSRIFYSRLFWKFYWSSMNFLKERESFPLLLVLRSTGAGEGTGFCFAAGMGRGCGEDS
jgi:hypothetical protein